VRGLPPASRREFLGAVYGGGSAGTVRLSGVAADTVRRIVDEGRDTVLATARAGLAPDLARLLSVPGVTLDDVVAVHRRTGAVTAADLAAAVSTIGHPAVDVDESLRQRIEAALPSLRSGHPRLPLGRAISVLENVRERLARVRGLIAIEFTGSVRRFAPTVGDLHLLVASTNPEVALDGISAALDPPVVLHRSSDQLALRVEGDALTVRAVPPGEFGFALLHFTGSAGHVRQLQTRALRRGLRLTAAGFVAASPAIAPSCATERDIYTALGLAYVAPELRHGEDEIAQAEADTLPELVTREHIRGDLHVHTLWSDGRDSVDAVARAAMLLGYEYVAITDHSQRAAASRVLTLDRLERQIEEVAGVRKRFTGIAILQGAEVEILPDGSLDFADDILDRLDVVLASLHEPAGQTADALLDRYVRAMQHPRVHIITHPANRLVGRDEGYALDYDTLFATAIDTGTVLEVDGGPGHLDMDGHLARRAIAAGVKISIDSDCHNVARLARQMMLGIGTARRGGVEAAHVINTRPLQHVLDVFAAKTVARSGESSPPGVL
jgi:DNA polymerase (family 10)